MSYEYLKIESKNQTSIITINRPEVYNALNVDSKMEIIRAIREANRDEKIKAIILTGEGKAFCSGQDLNDRTVSGKDAPVDLGKTLETEWNPLVNAIRTSKKIVIASVNGVCAGAGLSVAMACDLIISNENIKYVSGFSKLGLCPDAGSSYTFVKSLGYQKTLEFFLFNQPLSENDLLNAGMINAVSSSPLDKALEYAEALASMPPLSVSMIKSNLQTAREKTFSDSMQKETYSQRFLGASQDYQEGLKAFFEKRAPKFTGN